VLRHREDAEDVAQDAVIRALQRFSSLRDRARFRAWLVRVAWRLALDRRRADGRRAAREARLVHPDGVDVGVEHDALARERAACLWAAIGDLPDRLRQPLVLGMIDGNRVEDVAAPLALPVGTVKSRTFEARRRLKRALAGAGLVAALAGLLLGVPSLRPLQRPADLTPAACPRSRKSAMPTSPSAAT
jgi:RNA polymerase sigma-70 factor (ECF subfamily)